MSKKYDMFRSLNGLHTATQTINTSLVLPAGAYELIYDSQNNVLYFKELVINHDSIVDLPSKEYDAVVRDITFFLKEETKERFNKLGFLYKRSSLLYGKPGTGKTVLIARIVREVISQGGIVLFNPNPDLIQSAFEQLDVLQPNTMTMVIFEELDELLKKHEGTLLSILDGEVQKNNVIYMATTNHIDQIPPRMLRPGRFSTVMEVKYPNDEAREVYLKAKLGADAEVKEWVKLSEGLSIDELKETVVSIACLLQPIEEVIGRIRKTKGHADEYEEEVEYRKGKSKKRYNKRNNGFDYDDDYGDYNGMSMEEIAKSVKDRE